MELRRYLGRLLAGWRWIAGAMVVCVLGGIAVSATTVPEYAATSRLFVSTSGSTDASGAYQGNLFSQQRAASYAELIQGTELAQQVVDDLDLPITASQLASQVSAAVVRNTVLLDVTAHDRNPDRAREIADSLADRFTKVVSKIEAPAEGAQPFAKVTVVERAVTPTRPVVPNVPLYIVLSIVVGALAGVFLASVRDRLDNTVKSTEGVAAASGSGMIGTVPFDKERAKHAAIQFKESHSSAAEAFRQIRTNLQYVDVDNPPRVLVVSSPIAGDGKTTTAINLALVLAEAGSTVVLLEADLRRPQVVEYLGLVAGVGISSLLSTSDLAVEDVLQDVGPSGNLSVLGSGPRPPNPSELLGSTHMLELVATLRASFDYVVVDAPPLLPVTDAAVLATVADGILLVSRHGKTKREHVERAAAAVTAVDARLLGNILNCVPHRRRSGYAYSYYYEPETGRHLGKDVDLHPFAAAAAEGGDIRGAHSTWEVDSRSASRTAR